jgi:hypothetical protein
VAVASVAASPSSTAAAGTGGSGAIDGPASATTIVSSLACGGADSVLGGWGRGSEETTRTLNTKRFRGPKLSTRCRHVYEKTGDNVSKQVGRSTTKRN